MIQFLATKKVQSWVGGWVGVKAVLRIAYSNQTQPTNFAFQFNLFHKNNIVKCGPSLAYLHLGDFSQLQIILDQACLFQFKLTSLIPLLPSIKSMQCRLFQTQPWQLILLGSYCSILLVTNFSIKGSILVSSKNLSF